MKLSKIELKNFKSFDVASIDFNNFNPMVGECASGKSNLIESIHFLKDISEKSLNTIDMHGGLFIQNLKCKSDVPTYIRALFTEKTPCNSINYLIHDNNSAKLYYKSIDYEISINFKENDFKEIKESIKFDFEIYENQFLKSELLVKNLLILKNNNGKITSKFKNDNEYCDLEFFTPKSLINIINNNFNQKKAYLLILLYLPFHLSGQIISKKFISMISIQNYLNWLMVMVIFI